MDTIPTAYPPKELDAWAGRLRAWAQGKPPDDLPRVEAAAKPQDRPRDVFAYVIHEGKIRAPAAAMALIERLKPRKHCDMIEARNDELSVLRPILQRHVGRAQPPRQTRITLSAKYGVRLTRNRNCFSPTGTSVTSVRATAVALRGAWSIRAISPKMPQFRQGVEHADCRGGFRRCRF